MSNLEILDSLLTSLPRAADLVEVCVGLHWTAVVVLVDGKNRCGLAATQLVTHTHGKEIAVPKAGHLEKMSTKALADMAKLKKPILSSIGMATINALLPHYQDEWVEANAEEIIAKRGRGKRVVLVGHFPFVPSLQERVGELSVLELDPQPGDLPAEAAERVLPLADVVAITSMTMINHTLSGLLRFCPRDAFVMLLGPSTPLSPKLFDFGVHMLSGSVVTRIEPVIKVITQGGNFRQVHRAGVRLVNLLHPEIKDQNGE